MSACIKAPELTCQSMYRPVGLMMGALPMPDAVTYTASDHIAVITLNRPEARNAVNGDVARGLEAAVDQLEADPETWIGVLTANIADQERPVFCAGADLKVIAQSGDPSDLETNRGGFAGYVFRERTKPIVV